MQTSAAPRNLISPPNRKENCDPKYGSRSGTPKPSQSSMYSCQKLPATGDVRCRLLFRCVRRRTPAGVAGRDRTSGHTPCSAKPRHPQGILCGAGQRSIEPLGLTQHSIRSRSLSQVSDCCPTSVPLFEECLVVHGSVDSDRKLVGLAGLALCYENMRWLVPSNLEHLLTDR